MHKKLRINLWAYGKLPGQDLHLDSEITQQEMGSKQNLTGLSLCILKNEDTSSSNVSMSCGLIAHESDVSKVSNKFCQQNNLHLQ